MAVLQDLIPIMSSNTTPSGTVTYSGYMTGYEPVLLGWGAFIKGYTNYWHSNTTTPFWLRYQFPSSKVVVGYSFWPRSDKNWMPKNWTFRGSNDGSSWTTLDTQTNITIWDSDGTNNGSNPYGRMPNYFWFSNTTAYTYYEIRVTTTAGASTYCIIMDFRMYGWDNASYPPIDRGILDGVVRKGRFTSLIPVMTSNTSPSGVASVSSNYNASFYAYLCVNGDPSSYWHSGVQASIGSWFKYQFDQPKIVVAYSMRPRPDSNTRHPQKWDFQGSEDGFYWVTLDSQVSQTWTFGENERFYLINNAKPYLYYRIANLFDTTDWNYMTLCDVKMYGYDGNTGDQLSYNGGRSVRRFGMLSPQLDEKRRRGF